MNLSIYGEQLSAKSGIGELMDDLADALLGNNKKYMLGGGNPGQIEDVNKIWRKRMIEIMQNENQFERIVAIYDTPQGNEEFLDTISDFFNSRYGWNINRKNICITNGSQTAFYILFNMFAGLFNSKISKKILLPLCPEYIGYADQGGHPEMFKSLKPTIENIDEHTFKYHIDFENLIINDEIGAICVSRPTNPTGNVLTDDELSKLNIIAKDNDIPLLIDNAYGMPFPNIIYEDVNLIWNENIILGMSLSKLGLPSMRTGIIIANEEIVEAVSRANAIMSLSNGTLGQAIIKPLIESKEIIDICGSTIQPYYLKKGKQACKWIHKYFNGINYSIHKMEGAFFLWVWLKELPISTQELYKILKARDVIIVPGHYFFYGLEEKWEHQQKCIRISYAQNDDDVHRGIQIIADVLREL